MLKLIFQRPYASLSSFQEIELPDFTVITGLNGVGKSHLLQSILQGDILANSDGVMCYPNTDACRYFDWASLVPHDAGLGSKEQANAERRNLASVLSAHVTNDSHFSDAKRYVSSLTNSPYYSNNPSRFLKSGSPSAHISDADMQQHSVMIKSILQQSDASLLSRFDEYDRDLLQRIIIKVGKPLAELTERDVLDDDVPSWGKTELFQNSFGRLFVSYRDRYLRNSLAELAAQKSPNVRFYSNEEFIEFYGPPPWDMVNRSLEVMGLDFELDSPDLGNYDAFQPTLLKKSTGVKVQFGMLSSGEKTLMSLAFCVYYSSDRRQLAVRPRLLLLDEIDAPLHPSMSPSVITAVTKALVEELGIKVILTTHSASTIAFSPEESIYLMKSTPARLEKCTKESALNVLTEGIPTMSFHFDGRRQVFVESQADARLYATVYKLIRKEIRSERSLEFVATGSTIRGTGDVNTGCSNVIRLVENLASSGNRSVFGIIDWDSRNNPKGRTIVIAHDQRDGLENILLDPLLLGILLIRDFREQCVNFQHLNEYKYIEILKYDPLKLQTLADFVALEIFGTMPTDRVESSYVGGIKISIDERYRSYDDHGLAILISEKFTFLRKYYSDMKKKNLMEAIVEKVLQDYPELTPSSIKNAFEQLLNLSI